MTSARNTVRSVVSTTACVDVLERLLRVLQPQLEVVQVPAVPVAYSAADALQDDNVALHREHFLDQLVHMMAVRASVIEGLHDARGRLQKAAGAS